MKAIEDSAGEIALWLAPGTVTRYPSGPQHGEHTVRQWMTGEWELIDRTWGPPGKLRLTRPGDPFEVWASPGMHEHATPWYINLQDPLRRVGAGFITMDHSEGLPARCSDRAEEIGRRHDPASPSSQRHRVARSS